MLLIVWHACEFMYMSAPVDVPDHVYLFAYERTRRSRHSSHEHVYVQTCMYAFVQLKLNLCGGIHAHKNDV